ncbi:ketohexokinase [Trifolium medium]|uniref:Ketohexokinase n=1 Tax=Trifolium medium TaxID=97028 RepID=A0A392MHZ8_9FABA|nr:ketohexokinase [Trifolium medium]
MTNLCTTLSSNTSPFIFNVQPHSPLQPLKFYNATRKKHRSRNFMLKMCSSSSIPQNATVVGCGSLSVDFLATVAAYPKPDEKIRTTTLKVQGGGNAGNALTCLARLGLNTRLISKECLEQPF